MKKILMNSQQRNVFIIIVLILLFLISACAAEPSKQSALSTPSSSQAKERVKGAQKQAKRNKDNQVLQNTKISGQKNRENQQRQSYQNQQQPQATAVTFTDVDLLLGCPTDKSITVNVLSDMDREVYFEYGMISGSYNNKTASTNVLSKTPIRISIAGLQPDTQYYYRIRYRTSDEPQFTASHEHAFHTQRAPGSTFVFTVEADYHRDQNSDPEEIRTTFQNILNEHPDFDIDLGDTFMGDKFAANYQDLAKRYAEDRTFFGVFGSSAPLYLVNGNHDGESGWLLNGTENNLAVWATKARQLYYPNPAPDGFYTGSATEETFTGQRRSYYSWEWGDALFVVLDPYWYTTENPKHGGEADNWKWTLGTDQYKWFKSVLETSKAKYKFVFTHHVLGDVRGGIEWADFYEWGGKSRNGVWEFNEMRPGWAEPIHQLMVRNKVSILFQGHDHLYVKQEKDGVIYQEVPQPSVARGMSGEVNEDSYRSGEAYSSPGHIRVAVSGTGVTIDYIHSALPDDTSDKYKNGEVVYSYSIH
jgi:hypothetical protein